MKLTPKKFERIAKLPFSGDFSPFAFRRSPKFDEIDNWSQFHQTLAKGELRKAQNRQQMPTSQVAHILNAPISPTNSLKADLRQTENDT